NRAVKRDLFQASQIDSVAPSHTTLSTQTHRHCADCRMLIDAVRNLEQQCCDSEKEWACKTSKLSSTNQYELLLEQEKFVTKMKNLEYRRASACERLLKHRRLQHHSKSSIQ